MERPDTVHPVSMSDHTRAGHIFVTVGSTEFDALIEVAGSVRFAELAANQGFTKIVIQYGRGSARPHPDASKHLDVHAYDYKPSLAVHRHLYPPC